MSSYSIVQWVTVLVYVVLIMVVLLRVRPGQKRLLTVYLAASAGWSLANALCSTNLPASRPVFWGRVEPLLGSWAVVAYCHVVLAFIGMNGRTLVGLGYGYLALLAVPVLLGHIPENVIHAGGMVYREYGGWLYVVVGGGASLVGTVVYLLLTSYFRSANPEHRNRMAHLLAGLALTIVLGYIFTAAAPLQSTASAVNAVVLTYITLRYRLPDMKLIARKSLVYVAASVCITIVYLVLLSGLNYLLSRWSMSVGIVATVTMVVIVSCLFNALRTALHRSANRLFYGRRYDYRQMVLSLAGRMSNVLDMDELADTVLRSIARAVGASQASLLFPSDDRFSTRFARRLVEDEPVRSLTLRQSSAVITWLTREDRPLTRECLGTGSEFAGLWPDDRSGLDASETEVLCPIKSKHKLIAILALSKKRPRGFYSRDDMDLLMTLAHEAAIAIENAQMYSRARERANTDELTGLYNHRYFHERLDEEITRSSRFGDIFSLILLDVDLFKAYNDIYGHMAGDGILEQVARNLQNSVRSTDICFRYGGDEFAVILPQTSLDEARAVADRIRRTTEARTDCRGRPLSCSLGIASWPTDAVMRAEIVRAADTALYRAKQLGRNRLCLACELAMSEVLKSDTVANPQSKEVILNTIYALAATVDAKDHHTYGHSKKVSQYATEIAEALGYSREAIGVVRAAALLHDIGKIGICDRVLTKRGPLSADEMEAITTHPSLGVAILKHVDSLKGCLAAVQYHHEHYDGSGYPAGLKDNNIPVDARVLAVADAYDAMTSQRPYRAARLTHSEAIEELERCAGTHFDPKVVRVFVSLNRQPLETDESSLAEGQVLPR